MEPELAAALKAAVDHLEYCGYGDSWERECAEHAGLPEKLNSVLAKYVQSTGPIGELE